MKTSKKVTLLTAISIAMAFTASCSSDKDDDSPSSSCKDSETHFCDTRDNKLYKFVKIGEQVWMAENLNYAVGGKCYGEDGKIYVGYDDEATLSETEVQANCAKYGRLYDWATAMNNSASSTSVPSGVQGVCPPGWHIPSDAEWDQLYRYADGTTGTSSPYRSPTAGKYLKAKSGWNDFECDEEMMSYRECDAIGTYSGNGEDTYGFSALPSGKCGSGGNFNGIGNGGSWWSSSESSGGANYRSMTYSREGAYGDYDDESLLFSVRCVKN